MLGIWGNSSLTGKSSQSDLVTGKITLPVVYGLSRNGEFAERWKLGPIKPVEVPEIINLLEFEGGKEYSQAQAARLLNEALSTLEEALPSGIASEALRNLAMSLVNRQS
jgi:geranylgeranyl diphosphate synthase type I